MNTFTKLECFIIGWNPRILKDCGEASYRLLKRYMAAIIILAIIWGTIGWCFADNYIGIQSFWGKALISIVFISIIICIERFIILMVGRSRSAVIFRVILAFLMAVLGSTVFDQIIFKNDVDVRMKEIRTEQINKEVPKRIALIDSDIQKIRHTQDSIRIKNNELYAEISKNPVITAYDVSTTTHQTGVDENGKPIEEKTQTVNKRNVENALINQAKANDRTLEAYQKQIEALQEKKLSMADDTRKEYEQAKTGFLEELGALYTLLGDSWVALAFYIFLFLFLTSLELLVITTKGSTLCDYDLIVEHQLNIKRETLKSAEYKLLNGK
ncbi:MAG: DUF4407 domain-containing protein [Dysgonomonas sp.]